MAEAHITLSQLQAGIKESLGMAFPAPVWVVAEIGDLNVNHSSGHCYLELVEKGGRNGVPKAQARAVIWRSSYGVISACFSGATGRQLTSGMKVLLSVTVGYHELYGLSLQVHDIDPLYTLGDLERQRQETIEKLVCDGVFDLNRELPLPLAPQRVAVVSSPNAAGFQDFENELHSYGYHFQVTLFEAIMQGHGAEESIIAALGAIAEAEDEFDVVVIIRGGGSQSDLSFLNSYMLSSHVAQFPLPVLAGLGHNKDQSVVDMVAAMSLKTPTAVAGFLAGRVAELDSLFQARASELRQAAEALLGDENLRLHTLSSRLSAHSSNFSRRVELRLHALSADLARSSGNIILRKEAQLNSLASLMSERSAGVISRAAHKLSGYEQIALSRDPARLLALGFAVVRSGGRAVRDASMLAPGEKVQIMLGRGEAEAEILKTEFDSNGV